MASSKGFEPNYISYRAEFREFAYSSEIKHGTACIFNRVEQSTAYESDRKEEQLQRQRLLNMEQIVLRGK